MSLFNNQFSKLWCTWTALLNSCHREITVSLPCMNTSWYAAFSVILIMGSPLRSLWLLCITAFPGCTSVNFEPKKVLFSLLPHVVVWFHANAFLLIFFPCFPWWWTDWWMAGSCDCHMTSAGFFSYSLKKNDPGLRSRASPFLASQTLFSRIMLWIEVDDWCVGWVLRCGRFEGYMWT